MSGSTSQRVAVVTASARSLPALMSSTRKEVGRTTPAPAPPRRSSFGRRRATIRHVKHLDAGHHLKQLTGHMAAVPIRRPPLDLARIGLGVGDKLRTVLAGRDGLYNHRIGHADNACDRRDVADEIEIKLFVQSWRFDRVGRTDQEERVASAGARTTASAGLTSPAAPVRFSVTNG